MIQIRGLELRASDLPLSGALALGKSQSGRRACNEKEEGWISWIFWLEKLWRRTFSEGASTILGDEYELEVVHDMLTSPCFSRPVTEVVEKYDGFLIGGGDLINPTRVS